MVVVDGDNQMFYNTSRERIMGEDGYVAENGDHEGKCDSAPSPDKHQDDTRDAGPEGFYSHETRDEPDCSREDSDDAGRDQLDREDMPTRCEGFECPFCPSKFSWRSALMQHQESRHRDEQMLICDQCDKIFTDAGDLQRHIRTQHAGTRAHSCPECGKTFATSSGLKQHTHIHSSVKPFICEVCLKSYTQFSNLCRHKRMHADCRTQLKCPTCGQMYTTITSLNKHRRFCHSASPLVSRHHLSPSAISPPGIPPPPSVLPYSPPLIGLPPSALYQASLAQMWNAQQALLAQSLGKAAMMPSPYLLGYPHSLSTPAPLYPSSLHPGAALSEGHKKLADGQFPSLPSWMSPLSVTYGKEPMSKHDDEEPSVEKRHREEERDGDDSERQFKRMRVESVSPAPSPPSNRVEQCPSSPADNEPTKVPSFIPRAAVSPLTGPNPPRITSPANSLGHQEDGRSAFSPPQVSPVSSTQSTSEERSPRKSGEQQPLDLTMQKTPSPPARSLHSDPVSPLSSSFPSDRLSHLLERRKSTGGLFGFPTAATGYPTPLPSSLDPMYKVKLEQHQQQLAQHYSRSAAALTGLAATFPPSNILGSPQAAFLKYHNLHHGAVRQFPFGVGGGVVYPASSKDMMIRGGKDRYTCKFCGKLFPRSANLTRHLRTHTGEQPYSCKYCDRSFSISSNLQRHVRNIHNKEKPFKCPLCDRCFGQQTNLDRHLKKHDNEQNGEVTTTIKRAPDQKAVDIDVEEDVPEREESGVAKLGRPGSPAAMTPSPPASPLRSSEPAQPLKIQYKIARGRSPLSSSGTCQSPPSTKIDSGLVSPPRDDGARGAEGEGEKVHPFSYMVNGPSSWDRQGLGIHKPKAILT